MKSDLISTLEMGIIDVNSEFLGVNRRLLMENAGRGLADLVWEVYQTFQRSNIIIFAGKGGNGGDGMVAARHLAPYTPIRLYLLGSSKNISKQSSRKNWDILCNMTDSVIVSEINGTNDIDNIEFKSKSLIVDTILGTGIKGDIREPLVTLLQVINNWQEKGAIIISADTPTGIDPNTGNQANIFLTPQWTGVFHKQKPGLSPQNSGKIKVIPIGIPPEAERIIGPGDLVALKPRDKWSKKGDRGKILVIGGNEIYSGAPGLAAMGAIHSGADLIRVLAPQKISLAIRSYSPELIVHDYASSHLTVESFSTELVKENDVILLGPGIGQHSDTHEAVKKILNLVRELDKPIVLDADALKLLDLSDLTSKAILTPHAGEFKALTDISIPNGVQRFQERMQIIQQVSMKFPNLWVVKGHWDIISQNSRIKVNKTGTPRMSRGGTGDVLAGLIAGFAAQTESLFHAACIGTYINGRAGELVENNFSLPNLLNTISVAINESFDFIRND